MQDVFSSRACGKRNLPQRYCWVWYGDSPYKYQYITHNNLFLIWCFSDHASQYRLFQITSLMHNSFTLQQYVCYITILNMFRAAPCSSSGWQIVLPQPLVSSLWKLLSQHYFTYTYPCIVNSDDFIFLIFNDLSREHLTTLDIIEFKRFPRLCQVLWGVLLISRWIERI